MSEATPQQDRSQQNREKQETSQPLFTLHPNGADFCVLAEHIAASPPEALHSALWPQRAQVAERLRQMAEQAEREEHQAAYHALRLLAW